MSWSRTIPITLPYLAALTPDDVQVEIRYLMNNSIEEDYGIDYDLVGVSTITTYVKSAYEIADRFRRLGRKVVMGGIHPSIFPEKSLEYCDSVVIGEAEQLWPEVIEDVRQGTLKQIYKSNTYPDVSDVPTPRYELLDLGNRADTTCYPVMTSRGCPNGCEFCGIPQYFGRKIRNRGIEHVLNDIRYIAENTKNKRVAFVDDNLIGNRQYAKELMTRMIPLGVVWGGEVTLNIADDPELLDLASRSGCTELSVGMESVNMESLREINKRCNTLNEYPHQVRKIRKKKIVLITNIMFGFDSDTKESLLETADALTRWKVPFISPFILRPIVGTRLYDRMEKEGRLLPGVSGDDTRTDVAFFVPKRMTPQELEQAYRDTCVRFYSLPSIFMRVCFPPSPSLFPVLILNLLANLKLVQWPRLKRFPLLRNIGLPLKSLLKAKLLATQEK